MYYLAAVAIDPDAEVSEPATGGGPPSAGRALERYVRRVNMRARFWLAARASAAGVGAGALTFLGVGVLTPPVTTALWAGIAWACVLLATATAAATAAWATRKRTGSLGALLAPHSASLASRLQSALELRVLPRGASPALAAAHAARVAAELHTLPPKTVVPAERLRESAITTPVALALGAALLVFASDRASTGAFALMHPGAADPEGVRLADVVGEVRVELVYPSYMDRTNQSEETVEETLAVPRGTTVHWSARPRFPLAAMSLEVQGRTVSLTPDESGRFVGRFVARESGVLETRAVDLDGAELRDGRPRELIAETDLPPHVDLLEPSHDLAAELDQNLEFRFEVEDLIGITEVTLVVRGPGGVEHRRTLERFDSEPFFAGSARLRPVEAGARQGDAIEVWIEATDGDVFAGPNTGHSVHRRITIGSAAAGREVAMDELRAVLDLGLGALAERLETPPDAVAGEDAVRARQRRVRASAAAYAAALRAFRTEHREGSAGLSASVLASLDRAMERDLGDEARLFRRGLPALPRRQTADATIVSTLEEQLLLIADLLQRAQLEDAAAIARELETLRREMRSLLEELQRRPSEEARRALMAALQRAQARMQELQTRLASLSENVPGEFLNTEAMPSPEAGHDALRDLDRALRGDDLAAAERALELLESQIDGMARALGGAADEFRAVRFGPRERAMAEARERLELLRAEQQALARRSEAVRREAAERAISAGRDEADDAAQNLVGEARQAVEALESVPTEALSPMDRESYDRALQRMRDAADALASADLGEARRMARAAAQESEGLARELEISAMMFPGRHDEVAEAARRTRSAAGQAGALDTALDEAVPRLDEHVSEAERRRLAGDATRQEAAERAARSLAERFRAEPDGAPLSPEGAETLDRAREAMENAARSLAHGDPVDASRAQQQASQELAELEEEMAQQNPEGGGGGGDSSGGRGATIDPRRRVDIPAESDGSEVRQLRRQLLDAMRAPPPRGYEEATRHYYEGLLR